MLIFHELSKTSIIWKFILEISESLVLNCTVKYILEKNFVHESCWVSLVVFEKFEVEIK